MNATPKMPAALKLVAGIFILLGGFSLFNMLSAYYRLTGHLIIDPQIVCLMVGSGLFMRVSFFRDCASLLTCLYMVAVPVYAFIFTFSDSADGWTRALLIVIGLLLLLLFIWMHRVLNRPEIRAFYCPAHPIPGGKSQAGEQAQQLQDTAQAHAENSEIQ